MRALNPQRVVQYMSLKGQLSHATKDHHYQHLTATHHTLYTAMVLYTGKCYLTIKTIRIHVHDVVTRVDTLDNSIPCYIFMNININGVGISKINKKSYKADILILRQLVKYMYMYNALTKLT